MNLVSPVPQPPFVGRDRELSVLRTHLATAIAGYGSLVLIGGEAGIGKTALAEMLCQEAAEQGAHSLVSDRASTFGSRNSSSR